VVADAANLTKLRPSHDTVLHEHEKRERAWTSAARWQAIQETIRWAEAQAKVKRNTPAACIQRKPARNA
jgi:hypothetical protein